MDELRDAFRNGGLNRTQHKKVRAYINDNLVNEDDVVPVELCAIAFAVRQISLCRPFLWKLVPNLLNLIAHAELFRRQVVDVAKEGLAWHLHFSSDANEGRYRVFTKEERKFIDGLLANANTATMKNTWHVCCLHLKIAHLYQLLYENKMEEVSALYPVYFPKRAEYSSRREKHPGRKLYLEIINDDAHWVMEERKASELEEVIAQYPTWKERREEYWKGVNPTTDDAFLYGNNEFLSYRRDFDAKFPMDRKADKILEYLGVWLDRVEKKEYDQLKQIYRRSANSPSSEPSIAAEKASNKRSLERDSDAPPPPKKLRVDPTPPASQRNPLKVRSTTTPQQAAAPSRAKR